jgi:hypothetical protein
MVKCAKCGFLGVRCLDTGNIVGEELRERGVWPTNSEGRRAFQDTPVCAVGACNFAEETPGTDYESTAGVLQKDRECDQFTRLLPALTPKEHIDMNVLQQQKEWQQRCDEENQRHHQCELWILGGFVGVCTLIAGACNIIAALLTAHH